jgi:5S rRNA maturation endonuclease (ribonuclease M5)
MTVDEVLSRLERVRKTGPGWTAACPAHKDTHPSLSVRIGDREQILVKCWAGCPLESILAALGLQARELFPSGDGADAYPRRTPATPQRHSGCTLSDYASAKGLSVDFLRSLGVAEMRYQGSPSVRFPYLDASGQEICVRFRVSLDGDVKVRTKAGVKHCLYGLNRLGQAREAGYVLIVEGESDAQTLWQAGYPAIGLPGANGWNDERDAVHLAKIPAIYLLVEPDRGGEAVLRWLSASSICERARLVSLEDAKDPSELYLADPDRFVERFEAALQRALPWSEHDRVAREIRTRAALKNAGTLVREPCILDRFVAELHRAGVVGETRAAKLLYLALTSRLLQRPVSLAVKGPSSGGKSYTVERVCEFFPQDAYYALTAMSERALAYSTEPLRHRFLVLYEAAGLESDFASYLVRSLLSEGRLRYETVEKARMGSSLAWSSAKGQLASSSLPRRSRFTRRTRRGCSPSQSRTRRSRPARFFAHWPRTIQRPTLRPGWRCRYGLAAPTVRCGCRTRPRSPSLCLPLPCASVETSASFSPSSGRTRSSTRRAATATIGGGLSPASMTTRPCVS